MSQPRIQPAQLEGRPGWQDWLGNGFTAPSSAASRPTFSAFRNGIYLWAFDDTALNELWTSIHITHDWVIGSDIYPHVHWSHTTTPTTPNSTIRWGIEYTVANGYSTGTYPATTTIYLEHDIDGASAYTHHITEVTGGSVIDGSSLEIDAVILLRIFRDAGHVNDSLTGDAFLHFVDCHYESDGALTFERNRPFTKT